MKSVVVLCALFLGMSFAHADQATQKTTTHTQEHAVKKDGKVIKNKKETKEATQDQKAMEKTEHSSDHADEAHGE